MTAPIVFGRLHFMPIVAEFLKAFPEVEIEVRQTDRFVNLLGEQVDVAVQIGELPDSSYVASRIGSAGWVFCASPRYLAERGAPRQPSDLAAHDCIAYASSPLAGDWEFRIAGAKATAPIRGRPTTTNAEAALDAAAGGAGIARAMYYQAAQAIAEGKLIAILSGYVPDPYPVSVVYPAGRIVPQKLRAFLNYASPRLKTRLQALGRDPARDAAK